MIDLVIPLSDTTTNDYLDLRYALRGFELYLKPKRVFLIGALPTWCKNVVHIEAKDNPESNMRERNMFDKLLLYPGEEFVYGNDDHFLLTPWQEEYHWDMTLTQKYHSLSIKSNYKLTVANTMRVAPLEKNYDVHCPMTFRREYLHRLKKVRWNEPFGFCLKSLYAQTARIAGVQYPDLKLREPFKTADIKDRKWFSTADGVVEQSLGVMNKLYPKKSRYE